MITQKFEKEDNGHGHEKGTKENDDATF